MSIIVVVPPAQEPVSLALAKNHLRLDADTDQDDELVQLLIQAAREKAEHETGRAIMLQTLLVRAASLRGHLLNGLPSLFSVRPDWQPLTHMPLPRVSRETLKGIDSVKLIARDGTEVLLTDADYRLDLTGLVPQMFFHKPTCVQDLEVQYQAGYGSAPTAVPAGIKRWMLHYVNTLYECRESIVVGQTVNDLPFEFIDGQLDPYRIPGGI